MAKDVRGDWTVYQTSGHQVAVHVGDGEDGNGFFGGTAQEQHSGTGNISDAKADDSEITFLIGWSNGARGRYTGRFDQWGRMSGVCYDEVHPTSTASWYAKQPDGNDMFGPM